MANLKEKPLDRVVDIHFRDIYPIWKILLWPGRKSAIEKTSAMKWRGGYDMDYLNKIPFFFGIWKEGKEKKSYCCLLMFSN